MWDCRAGHDPPLLRANLAGRDPPYGDAEHRFAVALFRGEELNC